MNKGEKKSVSKSNFKFAIVELKYEEKKTFIVPIENIKDFKGKVSIYESCLCFISTDISEEPDFDAKYSKKFVGQSGLFKVFIRKLTNSVAEAIKYKKERRIQSVPKKFRAPENTDAELNAEEKKRKKKEKQIINLKQKDAGTKNANYLVQQLKLPSLDPDEKLETPITEIQFLPDMPSTNLSSSKEIPINIEDMMNKIKELEYENAEYKKKNECNENSERPLASNISPKVINQSNCVPQSETMCKTSKKLSQPTMPRTTCIVRQTPPNATSAVDANNKTEKVVEFKKNSSNSSENSANRISAKAEAFHGARKRSNSVAKQANENVVKKRKVLHSSIRSNAVPFLPSSSVDLSGKHLTTTSTIANVPASDCVVINFDEIFKKVEKLEFENANYKKQIESLDARNMALQIALVTATRSPAKPMFKEEDGGRQYDEYGVFLNETQIKVLDAILDDKLYLNSLITSVFGSITLKKSSVTGKKSNRTKAPAKDALDPLKLQFIYDEMSARTNMNDNFKRTKINRIITKKIANLQDKPKTQRQIKRKKVIDAKEKSIIEKDSSSDEGVEENVQSLNGSDSEDENAEQKSNTEDASASDTNDDENVNQAPSDEQWQTEQEDDEILLNYLPDLLLNSNDLTDFGKLSCEDLNFCL